MDLETNELAPVEKEVRQEPIARDALRDVDVAKVEDSRSAASVPGGSAIPETPRLDVSAATVARMMG